MNNYTADSQSAKNAVAIGNNASATTDNSIAIGNAVKELDTKFDLLAQKQKRIDELEKRIEKLEKHLDKLEKQQ